jgi:hypothetical protein
MVNRCAHKGALVCLTKRDNVANAHLCVPGLELRARWATDERCVPQRRTRIMEDGRIDLFVTGKYLDEIVLDGGRGEIRGADRRPRFPKRRYLDGGAAVTRYASRAPLRN